MSYPFNPDFRLSDPNAAIRCLPERCQTCDLACMAMLAAVAFESSVGNALPDTLNLIHEKCTAQASKPMTELPPAVESISTVVDPFQPNKSIAIDPPADVSGNTWVMALSSNELAHQECPLRSLSDEELQL